MANEEMALLAELTEIPDFGEPGLSRTHDVMLALGLGLTAHLDPVALEPMQQGRERRRTGGSPRARYDPGEYDADRSRPRNSSRIAPPSGLPKQGSRNHAAKRSRLSKEGLGGGLVGVRKLYLCRWCGLPKKNHVCEGAVDPELLANRQQAARSFTAPRQEAAMSSSSSTGSTAGEEAGGADEVETVLALSPKVRAWQPPRKALGVVDAQGRAHVSTEVQAVGKRIEGVFLCDGGSLQWYGGLVTEFSESTEEHLVVYDDGEQKWHRLVEGMAQKLLRWTDAVGADDDPPETPSISNDQRKGPSSLSSRKRRERSAELELILAEPAFAEPALAEPALAEPALAESDAPAAQVCEYCNSRGKVHRRCVRLATCHIIWKRGGKKRRDANGDMSDLRRKTPGTPPTPTAEHTRTGREKGFLPGKRAQMMNTRTSETTAPHPDVVNDVDDFDDVEEDEFVERYDFVQSRDWPFPVIVPPEALGFSFPGVAMAATVAPMQAALAEEEEEADAVAVAVVGLVEEDNGIGLSEF